MEIKSKKTILAIIAGGILTPPLIAYLIFNFTTVRYQFTDNPPPRTKEQVAEAIARHTPEYDSSEDILPQIDKTTRFEKKWYLVTMKSGQKLLVNDSFRDAAGLVVVLNSGDDRAPLSEIDARNRGVPIIIYREYKK